jgi:chloramphenicol O-acetyltransferase
LATEFKYPEDVTPEDKQKMEMFYTEYQKNYKDAMDNTINEIKEGSHGS